MSTKLILIVHGEPNSTFSEILFKYFRSKKFKTSKKKIVVIGSYNLFLKQMKLLKYHIKFNEISDLKSAIVGKINIYNINFDFKSTFSSISEKSNKYIESCFDCALELIKKNNVQALINGPISKKHFLKKNILELPNILLTKLIQKI